MVVGDHFTLFLLAVLVNLIHLLVVLNISISYFFSNFFHFLYGSNRGLVNLVTLEHVENFEAF